MAIEALIRLDMINDKNFSQVCMPTCPGEILVTEKTERKTGKRTKLYINCSTAEKGQRLEECGVPLEDLLRRRVIVKNGTKPVFGYAFHYDERVDMVLMFIATFSTKLLRAGETRTWEEWGRLYISRDKEIFCKMAEDDEFRYIKNFNGTIRGTWNGKAKNIKLNRHLDEGMNITYPYTDYRSRDLFCPLYRIFPEIILLPGSYPVWLNNFRFLCKFLLSKDPSKKTGPRQKRIDAFVSTGIMDAYKYNPDFKCLPRYFSLTCVASNECKIEPSILSNESDECWVVEKISEKEPLSCLRYMIATKDTIAEPFRIYFTSKTYYICKMDNRGGYVPFTSNRCPYFLEAPLINYSDWKVKGTMLEYFSEALQAAPDKLKIGYIWAFLKMPVLEQAYKAGYKAFVAKIADMCRTWVFVEEAVSALCGPINKHGKNINSVFMMNRHQADRIFGMLENRSCDEIYRAVKPHIVRETMSGLIDSGRDVNFNLHPMAINSVDNKTFDAVADFLESIWDLMSSPDHNKYGVDLAREESRILSKIEYIITRISCIWGPDTLLKCSEQIKELLSDSLKKNMDFFDLSESLEQQGVSIQEYYQQNPPTEGIYEVIDLYKDYIYMVFVHPMRRSFTPYFESHDDIRVMHDNMCTLKNNGMNLSEDQVRKAAERIKRFVFTGKDYRVIAPTCQEDFVVEGNVLKHCVKYYAEKVVGGETNVMFIRKNTAPDKPFFTVEISNTGSVEQIHGSCNRNLSTEPALIPFVQEWQEKYSLQMNGINKVR